MKKLTAIFITLLIVQLVVAVACASHSCEWGNGVYFYTGTFCVAVALVLALFQRQWTLVKRMGLALLLIVAVAILWVVQFALLDFRIMCRLF